MKISKILVPIDFASCSMLLVGEAAELAVSTGATMTLLHVSELPAGLAPDAVIRPEGAAVGAQSYLLADAERRMRPFVGVAEARGAKVDARVRIGAVVPQILAEAEADGADLVVISTHGRSGLARTLLGSVAEQVVRAAHVPVMLVRRQVRPECGHSSCSWCQDGAHSAAEDRVDAEVTG